MTARYGLGIDGGGTFTDAVILDLATGKVLSFAKALTTRPDPNLGIRHALSKIGSELLKNVKLVSLATTFATNAIVENQGAEAGLILIGYEEKPPGIPHATRVLMLEGGHTVGGDEKSPLDMAFLKKNIDGFLAGLEVLAITGFFSVRNPDHELRVARLICENHDISIVLGHQLSMRLDAIRRATTAWWNARLIPLVRSLIAATQEVLVSMSIRAPLMIVRGDGTLMAVNTALDRPVDTLLSGPAASIIGAKFLSGAENALIIDMGGTTTDMALLTDGWVRISAQGAHVGKWKTHVEAAEVRTIGLGGDSFIGLNGKGALLIGPRRVVPICLLAEDHPEMIGLLKSILQKGPTTKNCAANPCSFYITDSTLRLDKTVSGAATLGNSILSEFLLFADPDRRPFIWTLQEMEQSGRILRCGLTPTDIRVAGGQYSVGNPEAAHLGLSIFSKYLGLKEASLRERVEETIQERLCLEAVSFISNTEVENLAWLAKKCFQKTSLPKEEMNVEVSMRLTGPVIGVGAPAAAYLPEAFRRLNTECILPETFSVACAVGAIVGMVNVIITGEIRRTDSGRYSLHTQEGREIFDHLEIAVNRGHSLLERLARHYMSQNHVEDPVFNFSVEDKTATINSGEEIYLFTLLRLQAAGRPNVWKKEKKLD